MPSTVVASFNYNRETSALYVVFVSGAIYEYLDVPENIYKQMKTFRSKGTFLNVFIKGKYRFKKLKEHNG
jgi:hypothetical protein